MIKHYFIIAALLISAGICFSKTVDTPYVVATWHNFCPAAVSYTFDDGLAHQFTVGIPMFNAKGFKLTLFTVISTMFPGWPKLQSAASNGHEIASHTMTHTSMAGMAAAQQTIEFRNSRDSINKYIPGKQCVTMAYPNCSQGSDAICAQYYIGARLCPGQIVPKTPTNFYAISSILCGSLSSNNTAAALNTLANNAVSSNGWCVYLFHDIDSADGHNHGGYSPVAYTALQGNVNHLDSNRTTFWVESFGNVTRYIMERDSASVRGVSRTADSITLSVTDLLNDTIFNYPITIRRPLPSGWTTVKVTQGAATLTAQTKDSNAVRYVIFDAVPDKGNIIISRSGTGVQRVESGAAAANDLKVWFTHKNMTFSVPTSAGLRLDVALYDLKGSRIAHTIVNREKGTVGSIGLPDAFSERGICIVQISDGRSLWSKQCIPQQK
jgi:peptidoglycan/xylan/chitin deacetylase (PgdA/CDA1 family)